MNTDLTNDLKRFFIHLESQLIKNNIVIDEKWTIDHICYRVESYDRYNQLKSEFLDFSKLLIESEVNGRAISTFKLYKPIRWKEWDIGLIELPAPKPGKSLKEGFEHIEIVSKRSFAELEALFSHCNLKLSGLAKKNNPELVVILQDCVIKFHPKSLEEVIRLELEG